MANQRSKSPKPKISVVLATRNEEKNIGPCLESVRQLADEIVVVDEFSSDRTREIASGYGARVYKVTHVPVFHATKQKALDYATGDWILQLDADERVSSDLAQEIRKVVELSSNDIKKRKPTSRKKGRLFEKHQRLIEKRDGPIGKKTGEVTAFFIPRLNYFLGKPLVHAGVYPDGVIRLVKKGKAHFPAKSVHEQIQIDGEIAWLFHNLEHHDSPTFDRYFARLGRYTDLKVTDFKLKGTSKNLLGLFYFLWVKPGIVFLSLFIRHKGFLDGWRGFLWSLFSALHFPIAYFKYLKKA